jgi:predicted amidohydrolase
LIARDSLVAMLPFKIAAAQVPSLRGDIAANVRAHAAAMAAAAARQVSVLVFPELSLTGYEPDLAAGLAITAGDSRLAPLVWLAQQHGLAVVIGAPLSCGAKKPALGAILISAAGQTQIYCKMHLGGSEPAWFSPGERPLCLASGGHNIGIAICADSSQPSHPQTYAELGADIYAAGVFLNTEWYATDAPRLAAYAARHRMLVLMANHAASIGTYSSVGRSAVWSPGGELLAQAEGTENALVIATSASGGWRGELVRI